MDDLPLSLLFSLLGCLIVLSAFFSSSETAMMALNRYRLRHLVKAEHRGAIRANALLERTDRLIGLILIGNNFANILASSIATVIALRLLGDAGIAVASGLLTLIILIFCEVAPKTYAANHPERIAFPAAYLLGPLLRILYPVVWLINALVNNLLRLLGITPEKGQRHPLSSEELRTIVNEAGAGVIPHRHQRMLTSILDLEKITVEDITIPRSAIQGIDINDPWDQIFNRLVTCQHTRLPVYQDDIDNIIGIIHMRDLPLLTRKELDKKALLEIVRPPYYVPEDISLNAQLLNFQRQKQNIALVVNEYGDIQGLVTLEDILEEIVGDFTSDPYDQIKNVQLQADGTFLVDGGANIRHLNRVMQWELPTEGPKTLNGLVIEHLEALPTPGTRLRIGRYLVEVMQTAGNTVKTLKITLLPEEGDEDKEIDQGKRESSKPS